MPLSQIINDRLDMNFRSYLNSYRIKEAQHLLEHSPGMNILEITLATGFNSKSSFNGLFAAANRSLPPRVQRPAQRKKIMRVRYRNVSLRRSVINP